MDAKQVGRHVLARAAAKVGGVEELAAHMDLSPRVLRYYIEGREPVPAALFLRAIDVILEGAPRRALADGDRQNPGQTA